MIAYFWKPESHLRKLCNTIWLRFGCVLRTKGKVFSLLSQISQTPCRSKLLFNDSLPFLHIGVALKTCIYGMLTLQTPSLGKKKERNWILQWQKIWYLEAQKWEHDKHASCSHNRKRCPDSTLDMIHMGAFDCRLHSEHFEIGVGTPCTLPWVTPTTPGKKCNKKLNLAFL